MKRFIKYLFWVPIISFYALLGTASFFVIKPRHFVIHYKGKTDIDSVDGYMYVSWPKWNKPSPGSFFDKCFFDSDPIKEGHLVVIEMHEITENEYRAKIGNLKSENCD